MRLSEVLIVKLKPVPKPHSLLLSHLPLMKKLRKGLPKDAHDTYAQRTLTMDLAEYFPSPYNNFEPRLVEIMNTARYFLFMTGPLI
jgi:hypothetical protein